MKVYHTDSDLIIEFGPLQRLFAFTKGVVIPKENIGQIYWQKHFKGPLGVIWRPKHRLGMNSVFLVSGIRSIRGAKEFWYLKHQEGFIDFSFPNVLSIDTTNSYVVDHVRVSLDEASAQELIDWSQTFTESPKSTDTRSS